MKLVIISHTEHYRLEDDTIVGLASTIMEINHLLDVFDEIAHVAMLHQGPIPSNVIPYSSERIRFIALPPLGGTKFKDKLGVVLKAPSVVNIINSALKDADYFQFRAPTGIGVYVIPYLVFFCKIPGWFKYAGNWKQEHAPIAYRIQKWLLEHQNRYVTINGKWQDQKHHCLSFENPCLTNDELSDGAICASQKTFDCIIDFCYVGRLEPAKGLDLVLDALGLLDMDSKHRIGTVHIVGGGTKTEYYKDVAATLDLDIVFHGLLIRDEVHGIYKKCHAILLPSASEGFPKVIAEAMNYGCLPIVSDVSSIGQYVQDGVNGFLIKALEANCLKNCIMDFLQQPEEMLERMADRNSEIVEKFSYDKYNIKLRSVILKNA